LALSLRGASVRWRWRSSGSSGSGSPPISPAEQFEALWPLTEGRRLRKRRHLLPDDGVEVEVDVYEGELEGLIVAEIEFDSEEQARGFEPPPWLGDEVTGDERFLNESLAVDGAPDA